MGRQVSWTDKQLEEAVKNSFSIRSVILKLGLVPAGGNYVQIYYRILALDLSTDHFKGMGWSKGQKFPGRNSAPLEELLVVGKTIQSHGLKKRLFREGLKTPRCELCGWAKKSVDGRIPVELDHINGNHADNRLQNLRILCPNCHSLQDTHRGRNKKVRLRKLLDQYPGPD